MPSTSIPCLNCNSEFIPKRSTAKYCGALCRHTAFRKRNQSKRVYTAITGNNAALFNTAAKMYIKDYDLVADVTFGKGVFWRKVNTSRFCLLASDIITVADAQYDFTDLPYMDDCLDVVVLDPPYIHNPGTPLVDTNYQNSTTTGGKYHDDIMTMYTAGMKEAVRTLTSGGLLLVKCQDEIESGTQRWSHIEIYEIAKQLGLYTKDMFVLIPKTKPSIQQKQQLHARKNHSYLWVFKCP